MAYANPGYVASIILKNKPQREFNRDNHRTVVVPFDSEYSLLLKNTTPRRAKVVVEIDGMNVMSGEGSLILSAHESMTLERFVDSLTAGKKFKFVSKEKAAALGHSDPTSSELGKVKVSFYSELVPVMIQPTYYLRHQFVNHLNHPIQECGELFGSTNSVNCSVGGTVDGSTSTQQFIVGDYFATEPLPTVIELYLVGQVSEEPWRLVFDQQGQLLKAQRQNVEWTVFADVKIAGDLFQAKTAGGVSLSGTFTAQQLTP